MHAGEAVVEALREERVERGYSVPGSHIHPIYDALSQVNSIRLITCKMEPNVSLMAEAHGRLTGKPGVCIVTAGPCCVNSMAGVAQAYGAASPMVHISGAVPLSASLEACRRPRLRQRDVQAHHQVDHACRAPGGRAGDNGQGVPYRPQWAAGTSACRVARLSDYSEFVLQEEPAVLSPYKSIPIIVANPDPQDVDRFAQAIMAAKSPVLAAGKGVIRQGAMQQLKTLSEKLQAAVIFAQDSIGVIPEDHPFSAGFLSGSQSHPLCTEVLKDADLVLCVGMRMGAAEMAALSKITPDVSKIVIGFDDVATLATALPISVCCGTANWTNAVSRCSLARRWVLRSSEPSPRASRLRKCCAFCTAARSITSSTSTCKAPSTAPWWAMREPSRRSTRAS
jgi:acetolactate synthase-1/2/3 large subunit